MIISAPQAGTIVSDPRILRTIPELHNAHEAWMAASRTWQQKRGCQECSRGTIFSPAEAAAIQAILNLNSDAVARLRAYLNRGELYVYVPRAGQKPELRQLK